MAISELACVAISRHGGQGPAKNLAGRFFFAWDCRVTTDEHGWTLIERQESSCKDPACPQPPLAGEARAMKATPLRPRRFARGASSALWSG